MASLRAATRIQHQTIEADLEIMERLRTRDGLRELLRRWYGFCLPFESALNASEGVRDLAAERVKTPWLLADLAALGGSSPESILICSGIPSSFELAEAVGAMYVTEGSTLGNSLIAKNIERDLALRDSVGYSFFCGYGTRTASMWRQFARVAEPIIARDPQPALASARRIFSLIHGWLRG